MRERGAEGNKMFLKEDSTKKLSGLLDGFNNKWFTQSTWEHLVQRSSLNRHRDPEKLVFGSRSPETSART